MWHSLNVSFFLRTIYTCALNNRGGVEIDLTVTPVESGIGELHDPIFKGRGEHPKFLNFFIYQYKWHFINLCRLLLRRWRCIKFSYYCAHAGSDSREELSCNSDWCDSWTWGFITTRLVNLWWSSFAYWPFFFYCKQFFSFRYQSRSKKQGNHFSDKRLRLFKRKLSAKFRSNYQN